MSWSFSIGSIAGTVIRIHVTFVLFLAWIAGASYFSGGLDAALSGVLFIVFLFACVLAHEFGHIFVARAFGVNTPDVVLLPIGGVARLERIPEKPREEFLIAIAGPLVNVAIALVLIAIAGANMRYGSLATVDDAKIPIIDRLAMVNLFLAAFNMLPAFPMDGGRVLRALLAVKLGFVRATEVAATIGQGFAFLLGFLGLFFNPILLFIAIFVYLAAASEAHMIALRSVSRGVPASAATMTQLATLTPDAEIDQAVQTLLRTSQSEFPVLDGMEKPVGLLDRNDIIRALKELGPEARVGQAMKTSLPTIGARACLDDALKLLQEKSSPAVAVVDAHGRFTGLITAETPGELMMVQDALPAGARVGPWSRPAKA
jgi:stage IV sporulation protein FB